MESDLRREPHLPVGPEGKIGNLRKIKTAPPFPGFKKRLVRRVKNVIYVVTSSILRDCQADVMRGLGKSHPL